MKNKCLIIMKNDEMLNSIEYFHIQMKNYAPSSYWVEGQQSRMSDEE